MKRILLPFLFFSSASMACYIPLRTVPVQQQIAIRHPQANVNYVCQAGQTLEQCINIACSYATQYSCRVISQTSNTYYIETYIPQNTLFVAVVSSPEIIIPTPVIVAAPSAIRFPPVVGLFSPSRQTKTEHRVYHRPRRR